MYTQPVSFTGPWRPKTSCLYNMNNRVRNYGGQVVRDSEFLTKTTEQLNEIRSQIRTGRADKEFAEMMKRTEKGRKSYHRSHSKL